MRPTDDCISREYILSFLDGEVMGDDDYIAGMNDEQREIREAVRNAPSVIPTERTGEWIKNDDFTCSACGYHMIVGGGAYNYCPNCGAKMG